MTGPDHVTPAASLLTAAQLLERRWYHSIEVAPGLITPGREHRNITITRTLLDRADVAGQRCLDIGTADGLLPMLWSRRGAARSVGQDFDDRSRRIHSVQHLTDTHYDYWARTSFYDMRGHAQSEGVHPFDVVALSAVLDHVFDPLSVLACARGMLRDGGLMLVETSAILDDAMAAHANHAGRFFNTTNYWELTVACLDYWLRVLRLEPIDAEYFRLPQRKNHEFVIGRVGIMARAVSEPAVPADDTWARRPWKLPIEAFLDWTELTSDLTTVPYATPMRSGSRPTHPGTAALDVYTDLINRPELLVADPESYTTLRLSDS